MKCPNCAAKITAKNYDTDYEWYDCPKCGNSFTEKEILKGEVKSVLKKVPGDKRKTKVVSDRPVSASKKRKASDDDALAKYEAEALKPRASAEAESTRHRDEVPTKEILNVWADEIENIAEETGNKIDRLNAREFFAMNLWREVSFKQGVKARDKRLKVQHCAEHQL